MTHGSRREQSLLHQRSPVFAEHVLGLLEKLLVIRRPSSSRAGKIPMRSQADLMPHACQKLETIYRGGERSHTLQSRQRYRLLVEHSLRRDRSPRPTSVAQTAARETVRAHAGPRRKWPPSVSSFLAAATGPSSAPASLTFPGKFCQSRSRRSAPAFSPLGYARLPRCSRIRRVVEPASRSPALAPPPSPSLGWQPLPGL